MKWDSGWGTCVNGNDKLFLKCDKTVPSRKTIRFEYIGWRIWIRKKDVKNILIFLDGHYISVNRKISKVPRRAIKDLKFE